MTGIVFFTVQFVLIGCSSSTDSSDLNSTAHDSNSSDDVPLYDSAEQDISSSDQDTAEEDTGEEPCEAIVYSPNPFASSIVSYSPGDGAGFGQDGLPDIVLGPPVGGGEMSGSLDVLTLGHQGEIILAFDMTIVDGEGPDLIVFENPFIGWYETAVVSASEDGENWLSWPCESQNSDEGYPGCAGVSPTLSHPDNCIDATDPNVAGGDYFDLAELGLQRANFIRIQDSGDNTDGGFDLDAVSIVNGSID